MTRLAGYDAKGARSHLATVKTEWCDYVVAFDHVEEAFVVTAETGEPGTPAGDANTERSFDTLLAAMIAVGVAAEADYAEEFCSDVTPMDEALADVAASVTR